METGVETYQYVVWSRVKGHGVQTGELIGYDHFFNKNPREFQSTIPPCEIEPHLLRLVFQGFPKYDDRNPDIFFVLAQRERPRSSSCKVIFAFVLEQFWGIKQVE